MKTSRFVLRSRAATGLAVAATAATGIMIASTVAGPASADVDPHGENARFVLINNGWCATMGYTADGHLKDDSGAEIPNSTWHQWDGNVRCDGKALFAWDPSNPSAEITLTIYAGGTEILTRKIQGDTNYCFLWTSTGSLDEHTSNTGGGGSGDCTAG